MPIRPITPQLLLTELVRRISGAASGIAGDGPGRRLRVALDGPDAADPGQLAEALCERLPVHGHPAVHVRAADFLRPASLRFEYGRTNPDSFYTGWLDESGLRREVLDPTGPEGEGRILPSLWDRRTDRATRAGYLALPARAVVLVSGPLLLGGGLPFDFTVHLGLSPAALARRTPSDREWTLPAFARYATEVRPASFADVVVRMDDPRHPALVEEEHPRPGRR